MAVKSVNPRVKIISVESERAPGFYASMKGIRNHCKFCLFECLFLSAGRPVVTECHSTLADGLAVSLVGANAFATAAPLIDKVLIVKFVFIKENKENNVSFHLEKNRLQLLFYVWLKWKRLSLKVETCGFFFVY